MKKRKSHQITGNGIRIPQFKNKWMRPAPKKANKYKMLIFPIPRSKGLGIHQPLLGRLPFLRFFATGTEGFDEIPEWKECGRYAD